MINNVCKALKSIFSWQKSDYTNEGVKSSQRASEGGELVSNEGNIPDNVSEPVISFVKCFRENPKRFKLVYGKRGGSCTEYEGALVKYTHYLYNVYDKVEDISYVVQDMYNRKVTIAKQDEEMFNVIDLSDTLTEQEVKYLMDNLTHVCEARQTCYNQTLEQRKQRTQMRLREKLTKIYRGGDNDQ